MKNGIIKSLLVGIGHVSFTILPVIIVSLIGFGVMSMPVVAVLEGWVSSNLGALLFGLAVVVASLCWDYVISYSEKLEKDLLG